MVSNLPAIAQIKWRGSRILVQNYAGLAQPVGTAKLPHNVRIQPSDVRNYDIRARQRFPYLVSDPAWYCNLVSAVEVELTLGCAEQCYDTPYE